MPQNRQRQWMLFALNHPTQASVRVLSGPLVIAVLICASLYSHSQQGERHASEKRPETTKEETDQALAFYTAWLMAFTGVLAVSTVGLWLTTKRGMRDQSHDMAESLSIARISSDAAKISADAALKAALATEKQLFAAIASQLPILRFQAPELLSVEHPIEGKGAYVGVVVDGQPDKSNVVPALAVRNEGKTQADLQTIDFGWVVAGYERNPRYGNTLYILPPIEAGEEEQFDCRFNIALTEEAFRAVNAMKATLRFFCRVEYTDFVGGCWAETAAWEWTQIAGEGAFGFVRDYSAPQQYNQKKRIWKPVEALRDQPRESFRSS